MKKVILASLLVAACFWSTALVAQSSNETIIIDDKNTENKTVIEIENGEIFIDGKKVAQQEKNGKRIKIIKQKTFDNDSDVESSFDSPWSFSNNKAMLGVRTQDAIEGAEVVEVVPNSAAEKAGIKKGDIITAVDGKKINNAQDLSTRISGYKPGDNIELNIEQDTKKLKRLATLEKQENNMTKRFEGNDLSDFFGQKMDLGSLFSNPSMSISSSKPSYGMVVEETSNGGLEIIEVRKNTVAEKAGLQSGDIIIEVEKSVISNLQDFREKTSNVKKKDKLDLLIMRNGVKKNLSMDIPMVRRRAEL